MAFNTWDNYSNARATADLVQDTALLASARSIAEQIRDDDGSIEVLIPPSAIERFSSSDRDRVVYRVIGPTGLLLAGYPDVPDPPSSWSLEPQWFDAAFRGQPIRAVGIGQPLPGEQSRLAGVIVGQTLHNRDRMVSELWRRTARQDTLLVLMAAILTLLGLKRGLTPLMRLRDAVSSWDPRSLGRFDPAAVQTELKPVITAFNAAVDRIEEQIEQKRQFIADAAHQLRTPLAVLRTQAAVGRQSTELADKNEALQAVAATAADMTRLTNQLLLLARAESESVVNGGELVDVSEIARAALAAQAERALSSDREISFKVSGNQFLVRGNPILLTELVVNLVDNAIRHTPPGSPVTACLQHEGERVELLVADTGPGIPASQRERVFERFYRIPGSEAEGSGLGLAIVRTIAEAHGGRVQLKDPAVGPGLIVQVSFPAAAR